jgi:hypothetical protein
MSIPGGKERPVEKDEDKKNRNISYQRRKSLLITAYKAN